MTIYTDGSCLGNGKTFNSGGFGVVVLDKDEKLLYTYNNKLTIIRKKRKHLAMLL